MKYIINIVFGGSLAAFLIFAVSESIRPGAAANFISLGGLFVLVFAFAVLSVFFPVGKSSRNVSLILAPLTFLILGGTIVFTWNASRELGKVSFLATLGAVSVASGAIKTIFGQKNN